MGIRESVPCAFCGAPINEPCDFMGESAPAVKDGDDWRRAVHAARYAQTLSSQERALFWSERVTEYISRELELMNESDK